MPSFPLLRPCQFPKSKSSHGRLLGRRPGTKFAVTAFAEFIVTLQVAPDVLVQPVHELKTWPLALDGAVKVIDVLLLYMRINGVVPLP